MLTKHSYHVVPVALYDCYDDKPCCKLEPTVVLDVTNIFELLIHNQNNVCK